MIATGKTKVQKAKEAGKLVGRLQLENKKLVQAGFEWGTRYDRRLIKEDGKYLVHLYTVHNGDYIVSGREGVSVIDIKAIELENYIGSPVIVEYRECSILFEVNYEGS